MSGKTITVLISGRGSNLAALLAAMRGDALHGTVTHVVADRPDVGGLAIAREYDVATTVVDHRAHASRAAFDVALAAAIEIAAPDLVVLAGFMRVLRSDIVADYTGRMINVHPSLLPLYPGLHTHRRALADGVRVHGCTVHFVTPAVDAGPIIAQGAVPVLDGDDETTLAARVLAVEHRLLPAVVAWFCAGRLVLDGARARVTQTTASDTRSLLVPAA
ncbi:MAG: phosphoribosylglycinamide formyltransferase [Betaproteobacteria bacterium]|nr:phosphoribosylglycinamide formyltransferase [Betaproteobacteria bacterium]